MSKAASLNIDTPVATGQMPGGIPYIIGNEAAERFSYYGMKAILIIFMTDYLGMSENTGTIWIHSFGIAVYFLPLFGALLADIFLGKYKTIISLSIVYCLGHLVLALYESQEGLAVGLALIAIGSGGIKPCVSSHVGDQFTERNRHLIERVFGYFYLSINIGAMLSTLATPWLLAAYGPSVAFGVPGLLMLIATIVFWMGRNKFIAIPPVGWTTYRNFIFSKSGLQTITKLSLIYLFIAFFWSLFDQTMSTWILQAKRDLMIKHISLFGLVDFDILPDQVQAVNPFFILTLTPIFSFFVYPFVKKFVKLTPLRKIGFGLFLATFSFVVIGWAESRIEAGHAVHVYWQFFAYFIITMAEVLIAITALEFSYTQAPVAMKSLIMGLFWLSLSVGNVITTVVNKAIVSDITITKIESGPRTFFTLADNSLLQSGRKIELEEQKNYAMVEASGDTVALSGTFVVGDVSADKHTFEVLDINQKPVKSFAKEKSNTTISGLINRFSGPTYYYFFSWLLLGAAVLFVPVAVRYKEEYHVHKA